MPNLLFISSSSSPLFHVQFEHIERFFRVAVLQVGHPAAGLHVRLIDAPKRQLFFEERTADICRAVKFPGPVVIENISEDTGVAVKKVFVVLRVVFEKAGDLLQFDPARTPCQPRRPAELTGCPARSSVWSCTSRAWFLQRWGLSSHCHRSCPSLWVRHDSLKKEIILYFKIKDKRDAHSAQ